LTLVFPIGVSVLERLFWYDDRLDLKKVFLFEAVT